jgi:hypothetical protein
MSIGAPATIFNAVGTYQSATIATGAFTPVAGRHYLVELLRVKGNGNVADVSSIVFSGDGLATFTPVAEGNVASDFRKLRAWSAIATASPTEGAITVTIADGTTTQMILRVFEREGVDPDTPYVVANVVNNGTDSGTGGSPIDMAAADAAGNVFVGLYAHLTTAVTVTVDAPWTRDATDVAMTAVAGKAVSIYGDGSNGDPTVTFGTNNSCRRIGIELVAASTGGGNRALVGPGPLMQNLVGPGPLVQV